MSAENSARRMLRTCPRVRSHRNPASRRRAGLSLVFVLIGLLLLGIVAVFAIPAWFDRHDVTLDNACELLSRDIRSLQNRAALEKIGVRLVFDSDGWHALDAEDRPVAGAGDSHPLARRFSGEGVFDGVVIEKVEAGDDGALGIDPRGLVSEHASLELSFRGEHRELKVHRGTGDVAVETVAR